MSPGKKLFSIFVLLLGTQLVQAGQSVSLSAAQREQMHRYLQASAEHAQFSGTVLVAHQGVPLFSESIGFANVEHAVPNRRDTVFAIASLTKAFTAAAILQLQEQGKLQTVDPVCRYLDDCPKAWAGITLHHLLSHTSGIPNFTSRPDWDEEQALLPHSRESIVALFKNEPLQFAPGSDHKYSNSGYQLLGRVIEKVSGKSWCAYLQENIFSRLSMSQTRCDSGRVLQAHRASGYYSTGPEFIQAARDNPMVPYAAGGMRSTVDDLLRWDQALSSESLLKSSSLQRMFTPVLKQYAYGWRVGERAGHRSLEHSGSYNGFSSYLLRLPEPGWTVIVLSNSDRASAGKMGVSLAAIAMNQAVKPPVAQLREILWEKLMAQGIEAMTAEYQRLKKEPDSAHDFGDETLLAFGYDLLTAEKLAEAEAVFRLNLSVYPKSSFSHDGLADVAWQKGDYKGAQQLFETALKLDPDNRYAKDALAKLKKGGARKI